MGDTAVKGTSPEELEEREKSREGAWWRMTRDIDAPGGIPGDVVEVYGVPYRLSLPLLNPDWFLGEETDAHFRRRIKGDR